MKKFEERKSGYEEALEKIGEEFGISLYAANVVMPNGEVLPMVKMVDITKLEKEEKE